MDQRMKLPFEAVVVRYVHDVIADERLNIGVVLLSIEHRFVGSRFPTQWGRVTAAFPTAELPVVRRVASAIVNACAAAAGHTHPPLFVPQDVMEFVTTVIPRDDAAIQFSDVVRGLTADPEATLDQLYEQFVGRSQPPQPERPRREDNDVWTAFAKDIGVPRLLTHITPFTMEVPHLTFQFERAWKNTTWHALQPLSFDLNDPASTLQKSQMWLGRLYALRPSERGAHVSILVGMPPAATRVPIREAAIHAVTLLRENVLPGDATIYTEDEGHILETRLAKALHFDES